MFDLDNLRTAAKFETRLVTQDAVEAVVEYISSTVPPTCRIRADHLISAARVLRPDLFESEARKP